MHKYTINFAEGWGGGMGALKVLQWVWIGYWVKQEGMLNLCVYFAWFHHNEKQILKTEIVGFWCDFGLVSVNRKT